MVKILLVYEDYTEMVSVETALKKVGFDVIGVSQELALNEQILTFHPHLVISSGKGIKVAPLSIGQKLKDNRQFHGKVILILPKGLVPAPDQIIKVKMDAVLDSSYNLEKLIQTIARLASLKPEPLIEKLQKSRLSETGKSNVFVSGAKGESSSEQKKNFQDPARRQRYEKYLKGQSAEKIDPKKTSLTRQATRERQKALKKDWDFEKLEELDELKREFATALFKKK